jgi:hypothetical protein
MKLINKRQLIDYYTDGAYDEETREYIINMLVKMELDEFNEMVLKDYKGFITPYQQKGYYIEN